MPAGLAITVMGERGDEFYVIEEGRAYVSQDAARLAELGPGDCCFFPPDLPHVFTVVSDEPVKVLVIYSPPYEESPDRVVR